MKRSMEQVTQANFSGSQYPVEAQLIALADHYCARMSPRAYRQPLLHKGILRDILLDDGQSVLPDIATFFIKELGFYPPGLLVQLISGEIGVVTKCGDKADTPIVHVFFKPGEGDLRVPIQRNVSLGGNKVRKTLLSDDPLVTFDRCSVWRFNEDYIKLDYAYNLTTQNVDYVTKYQGGGQIER